MKKLLLLAAAAVAFGANAQTLTQSWNVETKSFTTDDVRQGVGMGGKIYINNKADQKVYVVDQNGIAANTLPGGKNCGINIDEAGNLVVSNATFPNKWGTDSVFLVYNPSTPETMTALSFTEDLAAMGRCDWIGKAKGNMAGDGQILLVGGTSTGISKLVVADGETSEDDSFVASVEGLGFSSSVLVYPFMDGDVQKYLYVNRSAAPAIITEDGDNFAVEKTMAWENKGASNGSDIFVLGGKKYVVYPTLANYLDGFAIACLDVTLAEGETTIPAVVSKAATYNANPNGIQANWVNAEVVSETKAIIYHYVPGAYAEAYTFEIPGEPQTGINDVNAASDVKVRKVYENGQVYIIKGDVKYNMMGAQVK